MRTTLTALFLLIASAAFAAPPVTPAEPGFGRGEAVRASGFARDQRTTSIDRADYDRYLLPITTNSVPGANGSLWSTEWVVRNSTATPFAMIWDHCPPNVSPCPDQLIPAQTTTGRAILPRGDGADGAFLYVPKPMTPAMSLRVRDLSQNAQSFGTELPIVREFDYRGGLLFLDIPTDPKYRVMLRIYGDDERPYPVAVEVHTDTAMIETREVETLALPTFDPDDPDPTPFPLHPSYVQLDPLTPAVRAAGERVRVIVRSLLYVPGPPPSASVPMWAFITVTNNETQQVTTVTHKP